MDYQWLHRILQYDSVADGLIKPKYVVSYYSTSSRTEYHILLTEDALKDPTELRKSVKRILEVIVVGLLKYRISASDEHASKKCCIEAKIRKEL